MNAVRAAATVALMLVLGSLPCTLRAGVGPAPDVLDEVTIKGQRARLREMRDQINALEDRFYERYNALNPVPEFAVHCGRENRTGTLLQKRYCRAVYEDRAMHEEARDSLLIRQVIQEQLRAGAREPKAFNGPPVQAIVAIEMRRPAFRRNLEEVVGRDAALSGLLKQRAELIERANALQREIFAR